MRLVKQPEGSFLCGQACVAMVAGISLRQAIRSVGHSHSTTTRDLVKGLRALNLACPDRLVRWTERVYPKEICIAKMIFTNYHSWHWVVVDLNGAIFDPGEGGASGRFTSFLPITKKSSF